MGPRLGQDIPTSFESKFGQTSMLGLRSRCLHFLTQCQLRKRKGKTVWFLPIGHLVSLMNRLCPVEPMTQTSTSNARELCTSPMQSMEKEGATSTLHLKTSNEIRRLPAVLQSASGDARSSISCFHVLYTVFHSFRTFLQINMQEHAKTVKHLTFVPPTVVESTLANRPTLGSVISSNFPD